jgi:hypothetical protein
MPAADRRRSCPAAALLRTPQPATGNKEDLCCIQFMRRWLQVVYDVAGTNTLLRTCLQDALSNSNGCLATIPKCEAGACATRNIMGVARWACLRCSGNYEPVVDASGQDNIIQCGEPHKPF